MTMYVANSFLRTLALESVRWVVPSVRSLEVAPIGKFLVPGNWRVTSLDVPSEDRAAARAEADAIEGDGVWVWVPDDHPLVGRPFGGEFGGPPAPPPANPDDHPLLALAKAVQAMTGEDYVTAIMQEGHPTPMQDERPTRRRSGRLAAFVRVWHALVPPRSSPRGES